MFPEEQKPLYEIKKPIHNMKLEFNKDAEILKKTQTKMIRKM